MDVFSKRSKTQLEFFNEVIIFMVMYSIFVYTPWFASDEEKFMIGYVTIGIVVLHIVVNLSILLGSMAKNAKLKCKNRRLRKRLDAYRSKLRQRLELKQKRRDIAMKSRKWWTWQEPVEDQILNSAIEMSERSKPEPQKHKTQRDQAQNLSKQPLGNDVHSGLQIS